MPELLRTLLVSVLGAAVPTFALVATTVIARRRMRQRALTSGASHVRLQMQHKMSAPSHPIDLAPGVIVMHRILPKYVFRPKILKKSDISYAAEVIGPNEKIQDALRSAYMEALKRNVLPRAEGSWDSFSIRDMPTLGERDGDPGFVFRGGSIFLVNHGEQSQHSVRIPSIRDSEPLTDKEASVVSATSAQSLDHALAMLFIRLGPPPEPSAIDYAPASNGGGGVQQ